MIVLEVPKLVDRKLSLVRAVIDKYVVSCPDDSIRRDIEALKPPGGPPTDDPEPDWTLGDACALWLHARILSRTPQGSPAAEGGEDVRC